MMDATRPYDVAVAGFGPTGATLAGLLGRRGLRVLVVEREPEVYRLPRAVHFDHEVMRTFQSLGIADALLPHTRVIPRCEFWNARREVLLEASLDEGETDQGWNSDYMFHQPTLERLLRDAAEACPGVDVRIGSLVDYTEKDDAVELAIDGADAGTARARYLVGCDGAASAVRRRAGLALEDLGFDEPWVVVDVLGARGLPDICVQLCDPSRPTTLVPGARGFYRFEFMLRPGETDEEMMRPDSQRKLLAEWLDPDSVEIVRGAVYRFHAIVAAEWWRGRVGIAGDAAHQTPPFLGQGMCAGIRDASNLAWKLALALEGRGGPELLASYGRERAPHVREFIERAVVTGNIICTQDEGLARDRDARMLAQRRERGVVPLSKEMPSAGPGVFASGEHPLMRQFAPQPRVRRAHAEGLLDDLTGSGFALLLRDERGWPDAARRARLADLGGRAILWSDLEGAAPEGGWRVVDGAGAAAAFFDGHGVHAFLVRPDHVVFGVARRPDEVTPLVDALWDALSAA